MVRYPLAITIAEDPSEECPTCARLPETPSSLTRLSKGSGILETLMKLLNDKHMLKMCWVFSKCKK
jgi:hypothetical protein